MRHRQERIGLGGRIGSLVVASKEYCVGSMENIPGRREYSLGGELR